jgi:hypothetical protein
MVCKKSQRPSPLRQCPRSQNLRGDSLSAEVLRPDHQHAHETYLQTAFETSCENLQSLRRQLPAR